MVVVVEDEYAQAARSGESKPVSTFLPLAASAVGALLTQTTLLCSTTRTVCLCLCTLFFVVVSLPRLQWCHQVWFSRSVEGGCVVLWAMSHVLGIAC